ncbi:hypothetical protein D3C73_278990 [compost metagenome]
MNWEMLRINFPNQWVLFETIEAHSNNGRRIIDCISLINTYDEGKKALEDYKLIHKKEPSRELYVAHTSKIELEIVEHQWLGVRI